MCVGCGLCDSDCPQLISYSATLEKINLALKEIRLEAKKEETDNA
jgi:predicted aldo/keto reductase-like oxidoreductase